MLPAKHRLPALKKLQHPTTFATQYFRVAVANNGLSYSRFGFVVSKKIDKSAVVRNRLKRVLRELAYQYKDKQPGRDMLFIVTKNFFEIPTIQIQQIVLEAFKKL